MKCCNVGYCGNGIIVTALTDRAIDALVYELYGLTAEEIRVVEGRS